MKFRLLLAFLFASTLLFSGIFGVKNIRAQFVDLDGDGTINGFDNCPFDFNPNQADADADGAGDVCDPTSGSGDNDGDGVSDKDDSCPSIVGNINYQGCPVGDSVVFTLHTLDQGKTGACDGVGSCESGVGRALIRIFDRNNVDFQTTYGSKNPQGSSYPQIFEGGIGLIARCTTNAAGHCVAGETVLGDYLMIGAYQDGTIVVFAGKPKGADDFVDTNNDGIKDFATKDLRVIKIFKTNNTVEYRGGSKTDIVTVLQ